MKKALFVLAAIGVLAVITFYYFQDSEYKPKFHLSDNSFMENVVIVQKKAGETRLEVKADKAIFETETNVKLLAVNAYYPEKELTLTSETGNFNTETKDLVIEGDIKAQTKGFDIVTNKLYWDGKKAELLSEDKVVIVGKERGIYIEGDKLSAHDNKATLRNHVKAIFKGKQ
jgi:LPS export ABC transporter protein LptC